MHRVLSAILFACALFVFTPAETSSAQVTAPADDRLVLPAPKSGHARPLVVIAADAAGAETTDFIIPYGVLREAGVADVRTVSTAPGPLQLMMQLRVEPDETTAAFDARVPEGADIVIVPAQMAPRSPALSAWLRRQAERGATLVSICEGARVLAHAGLLRGRRATSHFNSLTELERAYPETHWVRDRRYVQDGAVISTTGVSASVPVSLALVEAIAGRDVAERTAQRLGVSEWGVAHRTADFRIGGGDYANGVGALAAFWTHETFEIPLRDGVDEIALALRADAWGRSFRTKLVTTRTGLAPTCSRNGLVLLADAEPMRGARRLPDAGGAPVAQLDATFAQMRTRYGAGAERLARLGMEYDPVH